MQLTPLSSNTLHPVNYTLYEAADPGKYAYGSYNRLCLVVVDDHQCLNK